MSGGRLTSIGPRHEAARPPCRRRPGDRPAGRIRRDARPRQAGAQTCTGQFAIDFAGLPAGTIIGEQYAGSGVHISGAANNGGPNALIVFDSNSTDTDLDADLRVGIGNIAIFANNLTDVDPADGLVDRPDENNYGGRAIFAFDQDVSIGSFKFIDKDHEPDDFAIAYDASGNVIKQAAISPAGNGSVQTIAVRRGRRAPLRGRVRGLGRIHGDRSGLRTARPNSDADGGPCQTPTPTSRGRYSDAGGGYADADRGGRDSDTGAHRELRPQRQQPRPPAITPSAGQPAQALAVAGESPGRPANSSAGRASIAVGGGPPSRARASAALACAARRADGWQRAGRSYTCDERGR